MKLVRMNGIFIEALLEELGSKGLNNIQVIETCLDKKRVKSTCKELEKVITQSGL